MSARPSHAHAIYASFAALSLLTLNACGSSDSGGGVTTDGGGKDSSVSVDTSVGADTGTPSEGGSDTRPGDTAKVDAAKDGDTGGPTITTCDPHTGDECNMVTQSPCASDETCDYDTASGHNKCGKPPIGVVGKGEACDASNPCDRGLFCYDNKCSPPCCAGDNSVCGGEGTCKLSITEPSDGGADKVLYHVCTYPKTCHPFKFDCPTSQVCLFSTEPDSFACSTPTSSTVLKAGPGGKCTYANDCGESQICTELTSSGSDAGTGASCYLFCLLTPADAGAPPSGETRFPANGTCTVGGKSYGTCTSITGIGGGLGLCVKP